MKYTASMLLSKDDIIIFAIDLGDFDTYDEAKAVIEKHKETIDLLDYNIKAEYKVFNTKDDNDNDPEMVYIVEVSGEEEE